MRTMMSLLSVTPCNVVTNISHLYQTPPLTGSLDQREGEYWKHFKNINQSKNVLNLSVQLFWILKSNLMLVWCECNLSNEGPGDYKVLKPCHPQRRDHPINYFSMLHIHFLQVITIQKRRFVTLLDFPRFPLSPYVSEYMMRDFIY